MTTITALTHTGCGHVAAVANDETTRAAMHAQATVMGLQSPPWETTELDVDDAIKRLLFGPCGRCRIERIP